jgi:hypothetical protein
VTMIDDYVFGYCPRLMSVTFEGTVAQWNAITFGTNWDFNIPATKVICYNGTVSIL